MTAETNVFSVFAEKLSVTRQMKCHLADCSIALGPAEANDCSPTLNTVRQHYSITCHNHLILDQAQVH